LPARVASTIEVAHHQRSKQSRTTDKAFVAFPECVESDVDGEVLLKVRPRVVDELTFEVSRLRRDAPAG